MTKKNANVKIRSVDDIFEDKSGATAGVPIIFADESQSDSDWRDALEDCPRRWIDTTKYRAKSGTYAVLPSETGALGGVVMGVGDGSAGIPSGPSALLVGKLARALPAGDYHLAPGVDDVEGAALAWGLGAYSFDAYRSANDKPDQPRARLAVPASADLSAIKNMVEAVWFGRDLINTPASDLGPEELEQICHTFAAHHNANLNVITGDALLARNFPLIHAVGRASPRAPRLIEMNWTPDGADPHALKTLTLIGKGICFDTGGLDLKPPSNMLLMKKDMGGAATVLALAHMIMGQKLNIALKVLIPTAENSVAGNAFRPGDVITSRAGTTVEIGNTDAEGRLVLADALTYADETTPDTIITCATLTGAARVALGADLAALFATDDGLADAITTAGHACGDPVWRMPLWPGYKSLLDSKVADLNNIGSSRFGGAITAALFLKSFVKNTKRYVHVDLYGWQPSDKPLCPVGGDPQSARALFGAVQKELLA